MLTNVYFDKDSSPVYLCDVLSKVLNDIDRMKKQHDEVLISYESILEYLSSEMLTIRDLDHKKLEDLSCYLIKGVNLFTDLSDHILHLQKYSEPQIDILNSIPLIKTKNEEGPTVMEEIDGVQSNHDEVFDENVAGNETTTTFQLEVFGGVEDDVEKDLPSKDEDIFQDLHDESAPNKNSDLNFACDICGVSYDHKCNLKRHIETLHEPKEELFACDLCEMKFSTKWELKTHLKQKEYICFKCGVSFENNKDRRTTFKRHLEKHDLIDEKEEMKRKKNENKETFQCEKCDKKFKEKGVLDKHIASHEKQERQKENDKNLYCDICDKKFTKIFDYKDHKNEHLWENAVKCDICNKKFRNEISLSEHKSKYHVNPKPKDKVCEYCAKAFVSRSDLSKHMRIHTGEKPFKCEQCGKSFKQKAGLDYHLFVHTGIKEFQCDVCHKQFTLKRHLTQHYRLHTGEKPFSCEICDKHFHLKGEKNKHMKKKHDINYVNDVDGPD